MAAPKALEQKETCGDPRTPQQRQLFRLLRALICIVVLVVVPLLAVPAEPPKPQKSLEADKLVLRDANGKVRLEMGCPSGEPCVVLLDEKGRSRARLALAADGAPSLSLYDDQGNARAVIRLRPNGDPLLDTGDKAKAGPEPDVAVDSPADERLQETRVLFRKQCQECHDADGSGKRMRKRMPELPDFTRSAWQKSRTDGQLLTGILDGRGATMPPFRRKVKPSQARELLLLVRSFDPAGVKNRAVPVGDGDFDSQFQKLQRQWDDLDKQVRALTAPAKP